MLACVRRAIKYKEKDMIVPLYTALVRPLLEYGHVIWNPRFQADKILVERVQRRATRMIPSIRHLEYTARLEALNLPSLQHRRRRGDMIQVYKIMTGMDRIDAKDLFPPPPKLGTKGHDEKIFVRRPRLDIRKYSFCYRIVQDWNSLPQHVIEAETLNQFKARIDRYWHGERFLNPFS